MDNKRWILWVPVVVSAASAAVRGASQAPVMPAKTAAMRTTVAVPAAVTAQKAAVVADTPKPVPAYQLYTYYGDRYRDPFVPLTGQLTTEQGVDRPPQIASLSLKGVIQDSQGRMALLTSGVSSYILRGGRLYDGRNHLMKGISGVIKANSVLLMGSDHTVKEVKVNNSVL